MWLLDSAVCMLLDTVCAVDAVLHDDAVNVQDTVC